MARNVVEHIFGTLKRRFDLMVASPEYSKSKQAMFTLGVRASGNRWEHVRNIEGREHIYMPCDH